MAFVLTGGFARVSSFFWHFRRSFKFTAAPIANYVRSRCKVCCHHIAINQPLLFRTRFRMTYCRNTDLIWDEDTFDKIWSESDHLTPTRWAGSGRGSGWARCARTCTETESRLTQEQNNYLSNLGNGLHHQHPLLSQVWKDLGLKRENLRNA